MFDRPLSIISNKQKSGWIETWSGVQGQEIYKTLDWQEGEKIILTESSKNLKRTNQETSARDTP